jgi:uncharacterized protein YjiK
VAGCVSGVVLLAASALRPDRIAGPCVLINGPAMIPDIQEASGLAVSRRNRGIVWSHNDSGNEAVLFALDTSGNVLGRVQLPIRTRDWEDVSAGRCASGDCLYVADIGDNGLARRRIMIYRVPEPAPSDAMTAAPDVFSATYADGRHNAEAMFVVGDDLFIVTRDRSGGLYRANAPAIGGDIEFTRIAQLGLTYVTDAEASPDESTVVVRTSREAVFYRTAELIRGRVAPYLVVPLDGLREPQGEGVAMDARGMLYLASERRIWPPSGRLLTLRCGTALSPGELPS